MIKNCLLVLRNKKINNFELADTIISGFSGYGYYFDKLSYVAYDSSFEIVAALQDGLDNYDNLIILCPEAMEITLKSYISEKRGLQFDENDAIVGERAVYMLYTERKNNARVDAICKAFDMVCGGYERAYVKTVGARAHEISEAVAAAKNVCNALTVNVNEKYGDCTIEIIYDGCVSKTLFDKAYREIISRLVSSVYALSDETLAQRLVDLLKLRRMKISVAESFTGGGISKRLVEIPGVSEVYFEGLNTYSNKAKNERLDVSDEILAEFGAVSEQTARQMTLGLLKSGNCNVAVSTTGIAGPKSDNTNKPVGLVYIGVGVEDNVQVYEYRLKGSRNEITETAINLALFLAFKTLK